MHLHPERENVPITHERANARQKRRVGASWLQLVNCSQAEVMQSPRWRLSPRSLKFLPKRFRRCLAPSARFSLSSSTLALSARTFSNSSTNFARPRNRHGGSRSSLKLPGRPTSHLSLSLNCCGLLVL